MLDLPRRWSARLAGAALVLCACSDAGPGPSVPSEPAGITGRVTVVAANGTYSGSIKVEANPTSPNVGAKAVVTVPASATILSVDRKDVDFRVLATGQWVRVWFNGAVAESYPVQGTAATIVIDSAGIGVSN